MTAAHLYKHDDVIWPQEKVHVELRTDGYWLRWRSAAPRVAIYAGREPGQTAHSEPLKIVEGEQETKLPVLDTRQRWYFDLVFVDGTTLTTATRILPLNSVRNMRDIGGYAAQNGELIRWGRVYRSGVLSHISASDLTYLDSINLKTIADLRSVAEVEREPDHVPLASVPRYVHLPFGDNIAPDLPIWFKTEPDHLDQTLLKLYKHSIDERMPTSLQRFFELIAQSENLPLVVHCHAGKDRTGMTIAMLLLTLGVDEETVLRDYTLTNLLNVNWLDDLAPDMKLGGLYENLTREQLRPFYSASYMIMRDTLDYIKTQYGSIEAYQRGKCGIDAGLAEQVRRALLTAG